MHRSSVRSPATARRTEHIQPRLALRELLRALLGGPRVAEVERVPRDGLEALRVQARDGVPPPRLHEARRVAMAAANMIKALVQDVGTAMMVSEIRISFAGMRAPGVEIALTGEGGHVLRTCP